MNINDVVRDIHAIRRHFGEIIQIDNVHDSKGFVSWRGYNPGILTRASYVREYQNLLNNRQYSFLFSDGSFVQLYYNFNENILTKAKAALYPVPLESNDGVDELYDELDQCTPGTEDILIEHIERMESQEGKPSNVSSIRLDYDSAVQSHCKAHLQFGGINNLRISSNHVVLPMTFMESVTLAFFPEIRERLLVRPRYTEDLTRSKKVALNSKITVRYQSFLTL